MDHPKRAASATRRRAASRCRPSRQRSLAFANAAPRSSFDWRKAGSTTSTTFAPPKRPPVPSSAATSPGPAAASTSTRLSERCASGTMASAMVRAARRVRKASPSSRYTGAGFPARMAESAPSRSRAGSFFFAGALAMEPPDSMRSSVSGRRRCAATPGAPAGPTRSGAARPPAQPRRRVGARPRGRRGPAEPVPAEARTRTSRSQTRRSSQTSRARSRFAPCLAAKAIHGRASSGGSAAASSTASRRGAWRRRRGQAPSRGAGREDGGEPAFSADRPSAASRSPQGVGQRREGQAQASGANGGSRPSAEEETRTRVVSGGGSSRVFRSRSGPAGSSRRPGR